VKKILAIANPTGSKHPALERATSLLKDNKGTITLVGFCFADLSSINPDSGKSRTSAKMTPAKMKQKILSHRKAELNEAAEKVRTRNIKVKVKVAWDKHIPEWISDNVKKNEYDCTIKCGNRTENWHHTPTDWELINLSPSPVLIVAPKSWKKHACILAAIDLGNKNRHQQKLNNQVIQHALQLCELLDARLEIGFALEVPQVLTDLDLIDKRTYIANQKEKLAPRIKQLCRTYELDESSFHVRQGEAHRAIPSIANKLKADIVVTGAVRRTGIKRLAGHTAQDILSKLYTDIYTVQV
jgi:universal stress protein E